MRPINEVTGRAYPLMRDNVDTDVILPGRFLKTITRVGLGKVAFEVIRAEPGNVFDDPSYSGAPILLSGKNFGCGSSREHAAWALADMGIRIVIAESYSDIFAGNAFKNGILAIELPHDEASRLAGCSPEDIFHVSLEEQAIRVGDMPPIDFEIDAFRKNCLLKGLDEIELTLESVAGIGAFETSHFSHFPWLHLA